MKQNKQGLSNVGIANSAAKLEASEGNSKSTKKKKGGILTIKKGSNLPKENKLTNMMTTLPGGVKNNDEEDEDYSIDNEDEEGLGEYKQGGYHKVTIGDKLNHRYTVTEKLGWGHFSTVWMCQDKKSTNPKFSNVALKIQKSAEQYREAALDEIDLFRHITTCLSKPEAARENKLFGFDSCVVQFLHHFDHIGPNGKHTCMVFEVLGENMLSVIKKYNYKGIPISIVKNVVRQVCLGLDFLHRHCLIIHTDIKPENILMESLRSTSSSSPGTIKNPRVQLIPSSNTGESAVDSNPKTFSSPAGIPLALDTIQSVIQPLEQLNLQRADGTEIDTNCASPNALTDIAAKQVTPPLDISFLTAAYALTLESDQSAKTILEHPNGTDEPSSVGQKSVIPLQNPTGQGQLTTAHRNHLRTIHKNEHDDDTSPIRRLNSRHDVHSLQDLFHRNLLSFLNFDIPSISGTYSSSALHSHIGSAEYQPSPFDSAALDEQVMMSSVSHLISPRMKPPVPLVYTEAVTSNITISESWVSDSKAHIPLVTERSKLIEVFGPPLQTALAPEHWCLTLQAPGSTDTPPSPTTEVQMTPVKMTGRLAVQDEALVSFAIRAMPLTAGTPSLNFEDAIICSLFQASPLSMQPQLESSDQLWRVECEVEAVFHVLNLLEFKLTGVRFLSHLTVPEDRVNQLTASLNTVSTPIIEEFNPSSLGMSKCSQLVATETINSSSSSPLKSAYSTPVPISRTQRSFSNASVTGSILFGVDFETLTHRLGSSYNSNIGLPLQSLSVHINQLDLLVRPLDARLYVFPQLLKQLPSEASTPHSQGTSTPMSDVVTESVQKNSSLGNTTRLGVDGTTSLRKSITQTLGALISPRSPAKPIFMTHSSPSVTTPVNATLNVFDVSSSSGCINSKRKNMIIDRYIRWRQIGIASFNRINSGAVNNESISSKRNSFSRFDDASLNENDSSDHDLSSRELYRLDSCSSSNDEFDTHNNESHNHDSNNTKHNGKPGRSDTVSDELALKYAHCKVKIADLGNACYTYKHFTDDIQTRQYRSPEVILQAKYSTSADMWSLGCLIFELLTGDYLFDPHSGDHWSREEDHLALMFELLGPFPKSVYSNGRMADTYFHTKRGQLKHIKDLKPWPLLDVLREKYHFSAQESEMIVDFLLPMLQMDPNKRATPKQCLQHPWLSN